MEGVLLRKRKGAATVNGKEERLRWVLKIAKKKTCGRVPLVIKGPSRKW